MWAINISQSSTCVISALIFYFPKHTHSHKPLDPSCATIWRPRTGHAYIQFCPPPDYQRGNLSDLSLPKVQKAPWLQGRWAWLWQGAVIFFFSRSMHCHCLCDQIYLLMTQTGTGSHPVAGWPVLALLSSKGLKSPLWLEKKRSTRSRHLGLSLRQGREEVFALTPSLPGLNLQSKYQTFTAIKLSAFHLHAFQQWRQAWWVWDSHHKACSVWSPSNFCRHTFSTCTWFGRGDRQPFKPVHISFMVEWSIGDLPVVCLLFFIVGCTVPHTSKLTYWPAAPSFWHDLFLF